MKVILKRDVKGLGREGDLREVKDGYARNHLIPTGDQPLGIRSRAGLYGLVGSASFSERGGGSTEASGEVVGGGNAISTQRSRLMSKRSRWRPSACVTVATIVVWLDAPASPDRLTTGTTVASWMPVATRAVK